MEILSVRQEANGVIAIGQVATGFIAIGQMATGFIAIGQIARGVVAIGQLSIGGAYALGMGAVAPGYAVGMLSLAARTKGLLPISLVPDATPAQPPDRNAAWWALWLARLVGAAGVAILFWFVVGQALWDLAMAA